MATDNNDTNKPVPVKPLNTPVVAQQDPVLAEIERQRLIAKRQRQSKIGSLLDTASEVLDDVMKGDKTDEELKLRAAEAAIKLYTEQGKIDVAEDTIRVKERQLELERQKLAAPGGPLYQQNNVYITGPQQTPQEVTDDQQALLLRKQAQDALLQSFLPQKGTQDDEEDVLSVEEDNTEDSDE